MPSVSLVARAKINLCLAVGDRREDGFHEIDTVMTAIEVADTLEISLSDNCILEVFTKGLANGLANQELIPTGPDNLVWKAATHLARGQGWTIKLHKRIPPGSGLGGGSADAAGTLVALGMLLGRQHDDLKAVAAKLGSDVPFFLAARPCRARGRGDLLEPVPVIPTLPIVVAAPALTVSTAAAYAWLDENEGRPRRSCDDLISALESRDNRAIARAMANDFEPIMATKFPILAALRDQILELGAVGASLTGSGSGVFGVFPSLGLASQAAWRLADQGYWAVATNTVVQAITVA